MNTEVIITPAVTGAGDTVGKHPGVPATPEQVADAAIEAAKAGAANVHIHARDRETGKIQKFMLRDGYLAGVYVGGKHGG